MRSSLRFVLPLVLSVALGSFLFAAYQVRTEKYELRNDLQKHAALLAEGLRGTIEPTLEADTGDGLARIVERFGHREHLEGIAIYDGTGAPLAVSPGLGNDLLSRPPLAVQAAAKNQGYGGFLKVGDRPLHVYALPLHNRRQDVVATLVLYHETSYIETQIGRMRRDAAVNAAVQTILIASLALLLIRWTFTGPLLKTARWMRSLRSGSASVPPKLSDGRMFEQLTHEATHLARNLDAARAAAAEEARLRETADSLWTPERLRVSIRGKLKGSPLLVVSNREPYIHMQGEKSPKVVVPASGLVTALEPVLLACDGTWIAHGSGNADRETVDEHDRLRVPPESPRYTLRRVWLNQEEEKGYYFGFANEGLWPLCHTAHTRPIFRAEDWAFYQQVNRKFADAILEEVAHSERPIILVQDYHFALLPRLLKEARPDARVAIFWHIPWPNPEVFGICPWQRELLEGLLGADLIGFQIQFHCNNFLETVDRGMESLTEWDRFAVNRQGHLTWIRAFPISVAFPENSPDSARSGAQGEMRLELMKALGVQATPFLGVGVDRVDYTKGILERFHGVERFLELYPSYQKQFTFVQIGAPSRTHIRRYQTFLTEVAAEAERINQKFQAGSWKPIVFLDKHHGHEQIERYYRAADLCMVTSLHDGMNLVAKEFVASREDEKGVLMLSTFTGASRELEDALLVNPYDMQQVAEGIRLALEMSPEEKRQRMQRMRHAVRNHNVYRWAGNLLTDLCELRIEISDRAEAS
jgi:trehalose-6-phosphate synthase